MRYCLVDTFASDEHLGNPAAVVELDALPDQCTMQQTAHRIGVPTTAFVVPTGSGHHDVRWFTPHAEVNLCGHATIASARVLFTRPGNEDRARLVFTSPHGTLRAERVGTAIGVELPAATVRSVPPPAGLLAALRLSEVQDCAVSHDDVLVRLGSEAEVLAVAPDFAALARLPFRGHVVTARASSGVDFVSRTFFPALGVDEDQVCVSAHAKLAPFWSGRIGRTVLTARQLSARGGALQVEHRGDAVRVVGTAVQRGGSRDVDHEWTHATAGGRS